MNNEETIKTILEWLKDAESGTMRNQKKCKNANNHIGFGNELGELLEVMKPKLKVGDEWEISIKHDPNVFIARVIVGGDKNYAVLHCYSYGLMGLTKKRKNKHVKCKVIRKLERSEYVCLNCGKKIRYDGDTNLYVHLFNEKTHCGHNNPETEYRDLAIPIPEKKGI